MPFTHLRLRACGRQMHAQMQRPRSGSGGARSRGRSAAGPLGSKISSRIAIDPIMILSGCTRTSTCLSGRGFAAHARPAAAAVGHGSGVHSSALFVGGIFRCGAVPCVCWLPIAFGEPLPNASCSVGLVRVLARLLAKGRCGLRPGRGRSGRCVCNAASHCCPPPPNTNSKL